MKMGIERDILRWDIHDSLLRGRLARGEESLRALETSSDAKRPGRLGALERERDELLRAISRQGPSPRAKMG